VLPCAKGLDLRGLRVTLGYGGFDMDIKQGRGGKITKKMFILWERDS